MRTLKPHTPPSRVADAEPTPDAHLYEPSRLPEVVGDLLRADALTGFQAIWLAERWPDLPDDWASHPSFRSTCEHARAYIDHYRGLEASVASP